MKHRHAWDKRPQFSTSVRQRLQCRLCQQWGERPCAAAGLVHPVTAQPEQWRQEKQAEWSLTEPLGAVFARPPGPREED